MKTSKLIALVCALTLAAGCVVTPNPTSSATEPPIATPAPPPPTAVQTEGATPTPSPVETSSVVSVSHIDLADYPKVDGSTANLPLALALIQAATGCDQSTAEEKTYFTTTDPSYEALANGETDMLLVYEAADTTKKEVSGYDAFQINPLGRDALVFLVNTDNPVQSLTTAQLRDIYAGKITNWKQVGGKDQEIMAFQRQDKSGSQTLMQKLVMQGTKMAPPISEQISTMVGLIDAISSFDASANALGYSVYYYAQNMYEQPGVRLIAVDGVTPSNETIQSGEYPHVNEFFCVLPKSPKPNAKLLSDWLLSDGGQRFVKDCGYVPIR